MDVKTEKIGDFKKQQNPVLEAGVLIQFPGKAGLAPLTNLWVLGAFLSRGSRMSGADQSLQWGEWSSDRTPDRTHTQKAAVQPGEGWAADPGS